MKWTKILIVTTALLMVLPFIDNGQGLVAQAPGFPKINPGTPRSHQKKPSFKFHSMERNVQFIGKTADFLNFTDNGLQLVQNYMIATEEMLQTSDEPQYADSGLVVNIDTTQLIGVNEVLPGGTMRYDAYPVIIKNASNKYLIVGTGSKIPVIIEALDKDNNWRTIEGNLTYNRNYSAGKIVLKSGYIVAVAIPVYSGNFKTLLRIRVFDNYSESFTGYLNHSQLTEPVK